MYRSFVCALLLAAAAIACAPKNETAAPSTPAASAPAPQETAVPESPAPEEAAKENAVELAGRVWLVEEIGGEKVLTPADARQPFIEFDATEKFAHGFAGCNTFRGSYESADASLKFGPMISTKMACGPDRDKVEFALFQTLPKIAQYTIEGSTLTFSGADGAVLVRMQTRQP